MRSLSAPVHFTHGPHADQVALLRLLRDAGINGASLRSLLALTPARWLAIAEMIVHAAAEHVSQEDAG